MQQNFYLGIDVSKGYDDFIILNKDKKVVEDNFQLDDTFEGDNQLFEILSGFIASIPKQRYSRQLNQPADMKTTGLVI